MSTLDESPELGKELVRAEVASRLFGMPKSRVQIGRFVVEAELGAGAMGLVYAARDLELDRRVAIKVLNPRLGDSDEFRTRLHREAQLLARLNHPNVVTVHEVGRVDEQLFVAMEFVDGVTLGAWLAEEHRSWRAVLDVFIAAGDGLAAAHAAGLVHRDFKPDNVMLGTDERVRVMDFGLARSDPTPDEAAATVPDGEVHPTALDGLTRSGAVVGTPRYMAPEQHKGKPADERSDQFSFCAALYEGLFGVHAFEGDDVSSLAAAKDAGAVRVPPSEARVPSWVARVVMRGLRPQPADRFDDIRAVLAALRSDPTKRWRTGAAAGVLVGVAATGGWALYAVTDDARCTGATQQLSGIWDEERAATLTDTFVSASPGIGADMASRTRDTLDAWAESWRDAHREACEATTVRGEQSAASLDERMYCLQQRRGDLRALSDGLVTQVARDVVAQAVSAAHALPDPTACLDADRTGGAGLPRDPARRSAHAQATRAVALLRTHVQLARHEQAAKIADASVEEAAAFPDLLPTAMYWRAKLAGATGDYRSLAAGLDETYRAAVEGGDDEMAARAATDAAKVQMHRLANQERADTAVSDARAWIRRLESPPALQARLLAVEASIAMDRREDERARALFLQALELEQPEDARASVQLDYGDWLRKHGEYDEAGTYLRRGLASIEQQLGAGHPDAANARVLLGTLQWARGDVDAARTTHEAARDVLERALGPDHLQVLSVLNNLANLDARGGDWAGARDGYLRIADIVARNLGEEHPEMITPLSNLAAAQHKLGQHVEAEGTAKRALAVVRSVHGERHPSAAPILINLANWQMLPGQMSRAVETAREGLALTSTIDDDKDPVIVHALSALGRALVLNGQWREALPILERGEALKHRGFPPFEGALLTLGLAMALTAEGNDLDRARTVATKARDTFASVGAKTQVGWAEGTLAEIDKATGGDSAP